MMLKVFKEKFLCLGRNEDGAALVTTLAIFFLMYLGCMGVYAISMAVKERVHLQNAADAAAYSAAVVQADTFSRIATINRAMSWTYVQMSREQMDYIVLRWLKHTVKHYNEDLLGANNYNKGGILGPPCSGHGSPGVGWFIGTNPQAMSTLFRIRLNGLGLTSVLGMDDIPLLSSVSGLIGVGSTPRITEVETCLALYDTSSALKAISSFSDSVDNGLAALNQIVNSVSTDEPYANIETMHSIMAMTDGLEGTSGKYEGGESVTERLLKLQIVFDRLNIAAMNIAERRLVRKMPERIAETVKNVVRANIPEKMALNCRYYLSQNADPLDGEITGAGDGYFGNLYNNPTGERRFFRFSGYNDTIIETLLGTSSMNGVEEFLTSRVAGGVDQWFVRGNGARRTDNERGLQRSYKHWAEGPFANIHPSHSPLPPSCWNTDANYLHDSPASIALHSEWCWWSDVWSCPHILWKRIHIHPMAHRSKFWPWKLECDHNSRPGLFGGGELDDLRKTLGDIPSSIHDIENLVTGILQGRKDSEGKDIPITEDAYADADNDAAMEDAIKKVERQLSGGNDWTSQNPGGNINDVGSSGGSIDSFEDGCLITYPALNLTSHFVGYGRLYADAPQIYNSCYVGERAKPLILRTAYFGQAGTISVGIRRQNENPFVRFLRNISGIFTAFNPDWNGLGEATHTYVFSSAKAGYKDKDESAASLAYKVDWQPNNQDWNLCQSDWDAVFVPVRKAYSYAMERVWFDGDDGMLEDWVVRDADKWRPVSDNGGEDYMCKNIYAPGGMLRGNGHDGILDWRELSHVMFH